jgi:hypothetical protein
MASINRNPLSFPFGEVQYSGDHSLAVARFYEPSLALTPEKSLLRELLLDAIHRADIDWVNRDEPDYVFSFNRVCEEFNLDQQAVRRILIPRLTLRKLAMKKPKRRIAVDNTITHSYVHKYHCRQCRARYRKAYFKQRQSAPSLTANSTGNV